jgi:DNA-directed RNA polymerase subunit beta
MPTEQIEQRVPPVPRKSYASLPQILEVPNLIQVQTDSFRWFQEKGLRQSLEEISPIEDFTGNRLALSFVDYEFREPHYTEAECRQKDLTYSAPLYVRTQLLVKETGEIKEQDLFFGDIPLMTAKGTFITSGAERVAVSQLLRSPGVYFTLEEDATSGRSLCHAKLIPSRGAWLEFETSNRDVISAKINGKRKIPITTLMRAIGYSDEQKLLDLFVSEDSSPDHQFIKATMDREPAVKDEPEALLDIYRKLRPGDPPNIDNAKKLIKNLFFDPLRYDLGEVGRYKLNKRLKLEIPENTRALTIEDIVEIVRRIIMINNGFDNPDDIDHLGNRRVRTVGELIQNQFRIGLLRLQRVVRERMSIIGTDAASPSVLVNIRPVVAAVREFFGGSQLSQFMDQTNPLAELTHKRRLSAMGPGGLSRERAGFEVRDVHFSHYGRICPIETPEGPNIGLIGSLATYGRINQYGFIETPYRRVISELDNNSPQLVGRMTREAVTNAKGTTTVKANTAITEAIAAKLAKLSDCKIKVVPFVSDEVSYMTADKEDEYVIAQANARLDEKNQFVEERIEARLGDRYMLETPDKIEYIDVSPKQIVSVATALIPFLEHNDANRALMGSNMQRQAVPLLRPEAPMVSTGMEIEVAKHSGQVLFAQNAGVVSSVTSSKIVVTNDNSENDVYPLMKFVRTNQGTCINQKSLVSQGDRVEAGQVLADSSATEYGELALGQNVTCAFMSWEGYNFEDAIIISNRLVEQDKFASIHIEKHEVEARDTKLGPEEITRDIPNVGEESLRELDDEGIVRVGAEVGPDDILVGKITPKGETELSAEEKLLRAIFGEKAREVKDTSLRVPHGEWGKVTNVRVFSRENGDDLPAGVNQWVQVWIAQKRRVSVGDKLAGRHGNKGVISLIAPAEDMPFLPDGTPVDIILNPIGVPSRMNLGQVLETHLGWAAQLLGFRAVTPVFDGASDAAIEDALARAWIAQRSGAVSLKPDNDRPTFKLELATVWLKKNGYDGEKVFSDNNSGVAKDACLRLWLEDMGIKSKGLNAEQMAEAIDKVKAERNLPPPIVGKVVLRDGRSGEPFDQPVTVGNIYMMKLIHLVEDKVHARSTGPYSLITQQPLGGKAQFGGQRFGEMEVWALEAYGAAHNLQEILTIKSDDVTGRAKTYEAIVKNEDILQPGVPESFKVLVKELQSLGLAIEVINEEERASAEEAKEAEGEAEGEEAEMPKLEAGEAEEAEAPKAEVEAEAGEEEAAEAPKAEAEAAEEEKPEAPEAEVETEPSEEEVEALKAKLEAEAAEGQPKAKKAKAEPEAEEPKAEVETEISEEEKTEALQAKLEAEAAGEKPKTKKAKAKEDKDEPEVEE